MAAFTSGDDHPHDGHPSGGLDEISAAVSALFGAYEVGVLELAPVNLLLRLGLAGPPITVVKTNDTWATNGKVTYNITGTATPTMPGTPGGPTPFEFDATCPALR
jgi:hypothetical protein